MSATVTVTDGDGDTDMDSVDLGGSTAGASTVKFDDDGPQDILTDPAVLANADTANGVATESLNLVGTVGADDPGDVVFSSALDGTGLMGSIGGAPDAQLTSGGGDILLDVSPDGHTLIGFVNFGGVATQFDDADDKIFEITLNPGGDSYTIDMDGTIDDNTALVFEDFRQAPAGNNDFIGLDDPRVPPDDENQDLLFTGGDPSVGGDEVNTSSSGVGVNSQDISANEQLRIDFVTGVNLSDGTEGSGTGDSKLITTLFYDGHYNVNNTGFTLVQTGANAANRVDAYIQVYDSTDSDPIGALPFEPATLLDDPLDNITRIQVWTAMPSDGGTLLEDTADLGTFDDATIVVTFDPFGPEGAIVEGLLVGYHTIVFTGDGFSRMEITNLTTGSDLGFTIVDDPTQYIDFSTPLDPFVVSPASNDTFDVGEIAIGSLMSGDPITMSFDLEVTDSDLDAAPGTTPDSNELNIMLLPEISGAGILTGNGDAEFITGGAGVDTITGNGGDDILTGGASADTFVYDFATVGTFGDDTIADFLSAEDILSFDGVGGTMDVTQLNTNSTFENNLDLGVGAAGANDVRVTFTDTSSIVFADLNTDLVGDLTDFAQLNTLVNS